MIQRSTLLLVLITITTINVSLLVMIKLHRDKQALWKESLVHDDVIMPFISDRMGSDVPSYHGSLSDKQKEIVEAEAAFKAALRSIYRLIKKESNLAPRDFFEQQTRVPDSLQAQLWSSYKTYQSRLTEFIVNDNRHRQKLYDSIIPGRLEALALADDHVFETRPYYYDLVFPDTAISINITALMDKHPYRSNFSIAEGYIEKLKWWRSDFHSSRLLHRFGGVFPARGKVKVYSTEYDLSHITPAELRSSFKYVGLLKLEIDRELSHYYNE